MLCSQDADCFPEIFKYIICHVGIRKSKFCFNRCLERVLQERWPDVEIEWFLNRIYFVHFHQLNKLSASSPKLANNATAKKLHLSFKACAVVWMQRFNTLHLMFWCSGPAWWDTAARSCTHAKTPIRPWPSSYAWYAEVHFSDGFSEGLLTCTCLWKIQEF